MKKHIIYVFVGDTKRSFDISNQNKEGATAVEVDEPTLRRWNGALLAFEAVQVEIMRAAVTEKAA